MEYFSQFNWAVPAAYADALGQCQFGEGDILYPKKSAYKPAWESETVGLCLQVMYPPRQTNVPTEDTSEVFKKNWDSEVHVQKYVCVSPGEPLSKDGDLVISTQGRLYTTLWKGDLSYLSLSSTILMPTVNTKEVVKLREDTLDSKSKTNYINQVQARGKQMCVNGDAVFAMPYDKSNNTSNGKFDRISSALKDVISTKPVILTPEKAGIEDWRHFLPTVQIAFFVTNLSKDKLYERIKDATYIKSKDAKTSRYDIRKHGILID